MEPVPSLKAASLCKIAEEIWRNWNVSSLLTNYVYEKCKRKCDKAATSDAQKAYHALLEKVISEIMTDNTIPGPYKVDTAMAFIELEQNMLPWGNRIHSYLRYSTKENIEYCIEKTTLTQNGKINRSRTLIKAMFDSFATIQFNLFSVSLTCKVTKTDYRNFIWSEKYVKDQYYKLREKVKSQMRQINLEVNWETFIELLQYGHIRNVSRAQIVLESVTNISPDLWLHLVETRGYGSQRYFCLTLVDTLLCNKGTKQEKSDIIMSIYEQLDEELWQKIRIKYFQEIISPLFMSSYREYSLKLFNQVCYEIEEKACADILKHLLDQMTNVSQTYRCESIYFLKCKQIFLKMLNNTPLTVKSIMGNDLMKTLRELLKKNDFHFMSLLINDDAFNDEQKKGFIMNIILDLVSESELSKVDQFLQELPDHYNLEYAKTHAKDTIKKYIATKQFTLDYNAIFEFTFETNGQADAFRIEMLNDKDFLTDALASLALGGNQDYLTVFLKWGFNNEESGMKKFIDEKFKTEQCFLTDALASLALGGFNNEESGMKKFIDEKFKTEQWLVETYKKYLSNVGSNLKHPKPFLLHYFLPDPETQLKFKRFVREDEEFMLEALDKMMVENLSSRTSFLRCVFDKTEKKNRVKFVMNYVRSDRGLKYIYDMIIRSVTSAAAFDINNGALHHRRKLNHLIPQYFKFRKHWLICKSLYYDLSWVMNADNVDDLKQRVKEYKKDKREVLLPHENLEAFGNIAEKNYNLFFMIINPEPDYPVVVKDILRRLQNPSILFKTEDLIEESKK